MKKLYIGIIGATGLVGEKILTILHEEKLFKNVKIDLYVSQYHRDRTILFKNKKYKLNILDNKAIAKNYDIVFFATGEDVSRLWAKKFSKNGTFVIDNSSAFRQEKNIPLVVPEINFDIVSNYTKLISNPNCSTIQLVLVINAIKTLAPIEKIIVSTYQSVSGAGKMALNDYLNKTNFEIKEGIIGNVIPKIGKINENGFCEEENKIMFELNKILKTNFSICASTVRVPVPFCHTESVYIKFCRNVNIDEFSAKILQNKIVLDKNLSLSNLITDTNETHICRLRKFSDNEICFFVVADNLRGGAAYNATEIAKLIVENFLNK